MGIVDDLRKLQEQAVDSKAREQQAWMSIIPDQLAMQIVDNIYSCMIEKIKTKIKYRHYTSEKGALKRKHQYICQFNEAIEIPERRIYGDSIIASISRDPIHLNDFYNITPKNNGYIYIYRSQNEDGPDDCCIYCGNVESVNKVFSLAAERLKAEGLNCIYNIKEAKGPYVAKRTCYKLAFYIVIPCDKDGII